MQRKTLSERLTDKYQLIIRSEENFAEKWTINITVAKAIAFVFFGCVGFYFFFLFIHSIISFLAGEDGRKENERKLLLLSMRIDSLEQAIHEKNTFINSFKILLEGGVGLRNDTSGKKALKAGSAEAQTEEINFRKKMEKELSSIPKYKNTVTADVYFSPPIKGRITTAFDPSKRINGVMIHTGKKEVVQSISDGYILSIDKDSIGFKVCIQHKDGLVAIYSHLESVSKNTFDTVKKREGFATSKPSGIGFQMWYEGTAIDPQKFVAF